MSNAKSPNVGRQLVAAVKAARLPLAEKALLRALADSYHAPSGGAAPKKETLAAAMGCDVTVEAMSAARLMLMSRHLLTLVPRERQTTLHVLDLAAIEALGAAGAASEGGGA